MTTRMTYPIVFSVSFQIAAKSECSQNLETQLAESTSQNKLNREELVRFEDQVRELSSEVSVLRAQEETLKDEVRGRIVFYLWAWGSFKKYWQFLRSKSSHLCEINIFQHMGKIFCEEFPRVPLKFHTIYLAHALTEMVICKMEILRPLRFKSCFNNSSLTLAELYRMTLTHVGFIGG